MNKRIKKKKLKKMIALFKKITGHSINFDSRKEEMILTGNEININDLKCCGNCFNFGDKENKCNIRRNLPVVNLWNSCNLWTFDGIKKEQREI